MKKTTPNQNETARLIFEMRIGDTLARRKTLGTIKESGHKSTTQHNRQTALGPTLDAKEEKPQAAIHKPQRVRNKSYGKHRSEPAMPKQWHIAGGQIRGRTAKGS